MKAALSNPIFYNLLGTFLGADACRRRVVKEYIRPSSNMKILDIGCGIGGMRKCLPDVKYVGVDLSEAYILHARNHYKNSGMFIRGDIQTVDIPVNNFDLCLAWGILHHLDNDACSKLLARSRNLLGSTGRLLIVEACRVENQHWFAKCMIQHDRGEYIRNLAGYQHLIEKHFTHQQSTIMHDMLRVPYTYAIIEAWNDRPV